MDPARQRGKSEHPVAGDANKAATPTKLGGPQGVAASLVSLPPPVPPTWGWRRPLIVEDGPASQAWRSDRDVAHGVDSGRKTVDLDDSFGEGLRGFLRQVVPDAARDDPVCVFA